MSKVTRWLALVVLCAGPMWAQGSNIPLTVGPPPPVPSVSAMPVNPITTVAPQTLYYWVIARYASGAAIPTGPATVTSTPASLLDGTHRIEIDWTGISGVLGYDVVRNTTNVYPGTCAACAVVILTTNLTVNDTGGVLAAYPPVPWNTAPGVSANIGLNNQASPYPFLQVSVGGLSGKLGILSGAYAANDCIRVNVDGTISSTGVSCGAGGGGSVTSFVPYTGATANVNLGSHGITATTFTGSLTSTTQNTRTVECTFDGGGAVVVINAVCYKRVPVAGTITGWSIEAQGTSPAVTIDVLRIASGVVLPSASITAAATPALTSTNNATVSTAVGTWGGGTPAFAANDIVGFKVTVPGAATWAHIAVFYTVP